MHEPTRSAFDPIEFCLTFDIDHRPGHRYASFEALSGHEERIEAYQREQLAAGKVWPPPRGPSERWYPGKYSNPEFDEERAAAELLRPCYGPKDQYGGF